MKLPDADKEEIYSGIGKKKAVKHIMSGFGMACLGSYLCRELMNELGKTSLEVSPASCLQGLRCA